jgi:hypothetical protein
LTGGVVFIERAVPQLSAGNEMPLGIHEIIAKFFDREPVSIDPWGPASQ